MNIDVFIVVAVLLFILGPGGMLACAAMPQSRTLLLRASVCTFTISVMMLILSAAFMINCHTEYYGTPHIETEAYKLSGIVYDGEVYYLVKGTEAAKCIYVLGDEGLCTEKVALDSFAIKYVEDGASMVAKTTTTPRKEVWLFLYCPDEDEVVKDYNFYVPSGGVLDLS